MYSYPQPVLRCLSWAPFRWRVNPGIPLIERPGDECFLVGYRRDGADQIFLLMRFADGHESEYLPGDLVAVPVRAWS